MEKRRRRGIPGNAVAALLAAASIVCAPAPGRATSPPAEKTVDEILECQLRTRPLINTVRSVELTRRDRLGAESVYRVKVYGGLSRQGFRTLLIELRRPLELRGLSFMITEREGANHMFISPAGLPEVKRLGGAAAGGSLFGTDLSYEDVERLYGLVRPGETHSLIGGDGELEGRKVWQLETVPAEESRSKYWKIVSHVDRETCVLLKAEMYETHDQLRKVLTADPASISREGRVWVAHELLMRDLRDSTQTRMVVNDIELDAVPVGIPFTPEELEEYKRSRGNGASE